MQIIETQQNTIQWSHKSGSTVAGVSQEPRWLGKSVGIRQVQGPDRKPRPWTNIGRQPVAPHSHSCSVAQARTKYEDLSWSHALSSSGETPHFSQLCPTDLITVVWSKATMAALSTGRPTPRIGVTFLSWVCTVCSWTTTISPKIWIINNSRAKTTASQRLARLTDGIILS